MSIKVGIVLKLSLASFNLANTFAQHATLLRTIMCVITCCARELACLAELILAI